ncbi:MAG: hypothetical protein BM564_00410 [Bacteroidetes bacterium MedPE-SWsnd-G2]|nr:MAG: hypothetical protein BM564_00410 [Bacteroidetes bacterium MedPE-SWsnd-G2]
MSGAKYFYPSENTITQDGQILIEMYGNQQHIISKLIHAEVYLEASNSNRIELYLVESNKGEFRLSQALFCPNTPLVVGEHYTFKYIPSGSKKPITFNRYLKNSKTNTALSWEVIPDNNNEEVNLDFKFQSKEVQYYGCGPSMYLNFTIENDKMVLYKVKLTNNSNKRSSEYILRAHEGILKIGHGMCSGAFNFLPQTTYTAAISILDSQGLPSERVFNYSFDSPRTK